LNEIFKALNIEPIKIFKELDALVSTPTKKKKKQKNHQTADSSAVDQAQEAAVKRVQILNRIVFTDVILDFSCVNFIDQMAIERIKDVGYREIFYFCVLLLSILQVSFHYVAKGNAEKVGNSNAHNSSEVFRARYNLPV
jgi:hypothetical protein